MSTMASVGRSGCGSHLRLQVNTNGANIRGNRKPSDIGGLSTTVGLKI
jgi:hypothetical protein